jgi:integrase
VDPLHGWRHSFKTLALGAGIEERIRDAITGHRVASVGRKYEAPPVSMLAEALAKFPRYQVC